jgi:hypothetical protein
MKKYTLELNGHGVESVFVKLNEDSYCFWAQKQNEEDFSIAEYLCSPEDFEDIPEEFDFLVKDGEVAYWDDHEDIFFSISSPDLDSCYILVKEMKDADSGEEIVYEKFQDFIEKHEDIVAYKNPDVEYKDIPQHVMECNSYEKGTMFGAEFEAEDFDPKLLKILITEAPNGSDYFYSASYNGEDLCNDNYYTRGKGMEVSVWEKD